MNIKRKMDDPLSDKDIYHILKNRTNVILYGELGNYTSIDKLLRNNSAVILYETGQNIGHWVCIIRTYYEDIPCLEFFDPYAGKIDIGQKKYIDKDVWEDQNGMLLTIMLLRAMRQGAVLTYNHVPFQKLKNNIKTCGRWCILRILNQDLSLDEFTDRVTDLAEKNNLTTDELVVVLI